LSAPARQLLSMRQNSGSEYVFPSRGSKGRLVNIWHAWRRVAKSAGVENLRIHDLRHSFASTLASTGASLVLIGEMLGHSQPQTTARYAHLFDTAKRAAAETVGAVVMNAGKPTVEPVGRQHLSDRMS